MDKISRLICKGDFRTIFYEYEPKMLAKYLSFKDARSLAYKMLFNNSGDDDFRDFATDLLQEIRLVYPKEWSEDWKNDVFLGDACYLTMNYDERYEAYKRAYKKAVPPPPSLLISLASCYLSPGSPISLEEAEKLAKEALEREISKEGVVLLRGIYAEKNDVAMFNYWDRIYRDIEKQKLQSTNLWPDIHS